MKIKFWLGLAAFIVICSVGGALWVFTQPQSNHVAISQNGKTLYEFNLNNMADQTIAIEYQGNTNVLEIKNHQIHMLSADCLDQSCVAMGYLQAAARPIVCLPNRLVIQSVQDDQPVDASTQ